MIEDLRELAKYLDKAYGLTLNIYDITGDDYIGNLEVDEILNILAEFATEVKVLISELED